LSLKLAVRVEAWPYVVPFRITGYVFSEAEVVVVTLDDGGLKARGEACGVYYHGETPGRIVDEIESVRAHVEDGVDRESLRALLPPGGARNALDCALWDLEAKRSGKPAWELAGLTLPKPLLTTFTVSAGPAEEMAAAAKAYTSARAIKIKLTPDDPAGCVQAVRAARPDIWLGVDANQGFTKAALEKLIPVFRQCDVGLIEQPFPVGHDGELDGLQCPIPIAADESVQKFSDLAALAQRYDVINIKLDKSGGLTEGLAMAREARRLGLKVMVGCMSGTSLAMAPAFLLGQICDYVDLDAPTFLADDREHPALYENGELFCPEQLWGGPA
jgi:L-alanine-DL-glutamate epimerase-like enolase superfamily enzyme